MYEWNDECQSECFDCMKKENVLVDAKYWLSEVVRQLYSGEYFDSDDFEHCLEELAATCGLKIPIIELNIERRKIIDIDQWKQWNLQHLKRLMVNQ
jgi:hypothetical protein